ncbi:MAG: hypothetical protein Q9204_003356 [Flavoplaca sp. TL-2023a]
MVANIPDTPYTDDQGGKYILHAEDDGHFTITLDGRVVDDNHYLTADDIYKYMGYSLGYPVNLDWNIKPGRKAGCFDAKPRGCFVPYIDRSLEEIETGFEEVRKQWNVSKAKLQVQKHMSRIIEDHRHRLERVVSFGTGSFQSVADDSRRATSFQVLAMLTMLESINEGRPQEELARCFSQDPAYSDYDKKFLRSIGVEPVEDPQGFLLVNNDSVVCLWRTEDYVGRKVSERPWPAVLIKGDEELQTASNNPREENFPDTPVEAQRFQNMIKDCGELSLSALSSLCDLDPDSGKQVRAWQPKMYSRKGSATESKELEASGDAAVQHA